MAYASKYYDPVKAREYYLRTRELKGREKSAEKLSAESRQKQSEAAAYVRKEISEQKTTALEKASEAQTKKLEELKAAAEALTKGIREKLDALVASLLGDTEAQFKAIDEKLVTAKDELTRRAEERDRKIAEFPPPRLNPIPANASPKLRAFLEKENRKISARHKKNAQKNREAANAEFSTAVDAFNATRETLVSERTSVRDNYREKSAGAKEEARAQLKAAGEGLRAAVTKAREDYATAKKALVEGYSKDLKTELQNIQDKVR